MKNKKRLFVSFSGGRTSAFMSKWIKDNWSDRYDEIIYVFANTGKEREETLEFVERCDKEWGLGVVWVEAVVHYGKRVGCTSRVVDFGTASRKGEPFEAVIKKYGIPNQAFPHCTRELKTNPMHHYVKNVLGWKSYDTAIGIRGDETGRVNWASARSKRYLYPLITDFPVNKAYIDGYWESMSFDLHLKSHEGNCDACWKKSKRKLLTLAVDRPDIFGWWAEMELKYGNFVPPSRKKQAEGIVFGRHGMSILDILDESTFDFDRYEDDVIYNWNEDMDSNSGCVSSCEPFST